MKKILYIIFSLVLFMSIVPSAFAQMQAIPQNSAPLEHHDKFSTDLFTGSASYSYPLKVPKGTNDLTPNVALSYNSAGAHDPSTYTGAGWQLNSDYVQRNVNFTPWDTTDDTYKVHLIFLCPQLFNPPGWRSMAA